MTTRPFSCSCYKYIAKLRVDFDVYALVGNVLPINNQPGACQATITLSEIARLQSILLDSQNILWTHSDLQQLMKPHVLRRQTAKKTRESGVSDKWLPGLRGSMMRAATFSRRHLVDSRCFPFPIASRNSRPSLRDFRSSIYMRSRQPAPHERSLTTFHPSSKSFCNLWLPQTLSPKGLMEMMVDSAVLTCVEISLWPCARGEIQEREVDSSEERSFLTWKHLPSLQRKSKVSLGVIQRVYTLKQRKTVSIHHVELQTGQFSHSLHIQLAHPGMQSQFIMSCAVKRHTWGRLFARPRSNCSKLQSPSSRAVAGPSDAVLLPTRPCSCL